MRGVNTNLERQGGSLVAVHLGVCLISFQGRFRTGAHCAGLMKLFVDLGNANETMGEE